MWSDEYKGKKVLITGGLGFIGSNIAHKMTELGAEVTIMDSEIERLGANYHNLLGITDRVRILDEDIRDVEAVNKNVRWADIVFDLAAQVDYKHSDKEPEYDASINILGHQNIIEACRKENPGCRVIFPGSRTQYGKVTETDLPVKEEHALETTNPPSTYTAHKTTIDMRFTLARRNGFNGVVLRLTNPFGPRAQIKNPSYCVLNYFLELLDKQPGEKVLELGCSSGFLTQHLGEVTAIDTSTGMLDIAMSKNPKAKCVPGDMFDLKFKPKSFDKVVTMRVWNHLQEQDLRKALKQAHKVLKKNGILIFDAEEKNILRKIAATIYQTTTRITGYKIYQYSLPRIKRILMQEGFKIEKIKFLKHKIGRQIILKTKKMS